MPKDSTLGGYLKEHQRPPAFEGSDGEAYSVATYVDDEPDGNGKYGGALLFVRWSRAGDSTVGHRETDYLTFGDTRRAADKQLRDLSLHEVKEHLERLIAAKKETPGW